MDVKWSLSWILKSQKITTECWLNSCHMCNIVKYMLQIPLQFDSTNIAVAGGHFKNAFEMSSRRMELWTPGFSLELRHAVYNTTCSATDTVKIKVKVHSKGLLQSVLAKNTLQYCSYSYAVQNILISRSSAAVLFLHPAHANRITLMARKSIQMKLMMHRQHKHG